jgi:dUTPase
MKVIVEIPMEPYLLCVTRCGFKSPEYLMLKNGIVQRDSDGHEVVQILCTRERAKIILEAVAKVCPEALSSIQHRLDVPAAP